MRVWDFSLQCNTHLKFLELPMLSFFRAAMNAGKEDDEKISVREFITKLDEKMELLNMKEEMAERYLNEGFSGGEKKT